jgi:hypothetical protein
VDRVDAVAWDRYRVQRDDRSPQLPQGTRRESLS